MSSFNCQHCGKPIIDTPHGYATECEHHPLPVDHGPHKRPANTRQIIAGSMVVESDLRHIAKMPKRID